MAEEYEVLLPNGGVRIYRNKKWADNATLIARALAAMPCKEGYGYYTSTIAQYGQQSALARELGYFIGGKHPNVPNHQRIYNLLVGGYLPRSPEVRAKLQAIAERIPADWYDKDGPCLDK